MAPLTIEVLAYAPTAYFHCQHCEIAWQQTGVGQAARAEQMANNLPDDVMQDYQRLSDWIIALVEKYCGQVSVHVVDAASIEGFVKSLRYGVHRYPTAIFQDGRKIPLTDYAQVESAVQEQMAARSPAA